MKKMSLIVVLCLMILVQFRTSIQIRHTNEFKNHDWVWAKDWDRRTSMVEIDIDPGWAKKQGIVGDRWDGLQLYIPYWNIKSIHRDPGNKK